MGTTSDDCFSAGLPSFVCDNGVCKAPFAVSSGPCTVNGNCVRSPNYPIDYSNSETCEINAAPNMLISTTSFETEASFDCLYVNGVPYDSGSGPLTGTIVTSTITWT